MGSVSVPAAIIGAGALSAGSSAISGANSASASQSAAQAQANAATAAAQIQENMFSQTQANLAPFLGGGVTALQTLQNLTGTNSQTANPLTAPLTAPFTPTMASLQNTPGYQFTLDQGLKAAQNGYAAQGLGSSGAALKGGTNYAEGLAGTTYQQQFQNYLSQNQQIYNMLGGIVGQGENAGALLGNAGVNTGANIGSAVSSAGAATAAGIVGSNNALNSAISGGTGSLGNTGLLYSLLSQNPGAYGNIIQGGSSAGTNIPLGVSGDVPNSFYGIPPG